jgi:hypothetical protein
MKIHEDLQLPYACGKGRMVKVGAQRKSDPFQIGRLSKKIADDVSGTRFNFSNPVIVTAVG